MIETMAQSVDALPGEITHLLREWRAGNAGALDALTPYIYEQLRVLAAAYLRRERPGHTLQPTALVHETYLKLASNERPDWENRAHFYGIAARLMRQILVDHARKHLSAKRGQALRRIPLSEAVAFANHNAAEFIALNMALDKLAAINQRKARMVELRYFGGLGVEECAALLGVSSMTAHRDLRFAEAWLFHELSGAPSA